MSLTARASGTGCSSSARPRARARGARRVRRPLPVDRRARGSARRDRRVRDAVPQPRADRLRRARPSRSRRAARVVSTPYWYAQDMLASGAGTHRAVRRPAGARRRGLRLHRAAGARSPPRGRGAADRLLARWPAVAEATAAVLREAARARAARPPIGRRPTCSSTSLRTDHLLTLVDDVGIVQHAHGVIPNRDSGYCVDDVARLAVVALALARRGDEQAGRRSSTARSRSCTPRRTATARHAQLHELRPALARRAARRRPRRPLDLGARGDPLDGVGPGRRRPGRRAARPCSWRRWPARCRCARRRTRCSASRGSIRTGSSRTPALLLERLVDQLADAYERTASDGWRWFEDELTLRQRPAAAGADHRRRGARPDGRRRRGPRVAALARRRVRARRRHAPAAGPRRPPPRRAGAGRRRRAAARRVARSSRPSWPLSPSPREPEHGVEGADGVRLVPRDATGSTGRSTTSRPAAAATGSADDDINAQRGRRVDARLPPRAALARRRRAAGRRSAAAPRRRGRVIAPER